MVNTIAKLSESETYSTIEMDASFSIDDWMETRYDEEPSFNFDMLSICSSLDESWSDNSSSSPSTPRSIMKRRHGSTNSRESKTVSWGEDKEIQEFFAGEMKDEIQESGEMKDDEIQEFFAGEMKVTHIHTSMYSNMTIKEWIPAINVSGYSSSKSSKTKRDGFKKLVNKALKKIGSFFG